MLDLIQITLARESLRLPLPLPTLVPLARALFLLGGRVTRTRARVLFVVINQTSDINDLPTTFYCQLNVLNHPNHDAS